VQVQERLVQEPPVRLVQAYLADCWAAHCLLVQVLVASLRLALQQVQPP